MASINLLSNPSRVETPFIEVQIGKHKFGVRTDAKNIIFPNYIRSLQISKINGTVNSYTITIDYPITSKDNDPNFFEKVFASVADTRLIYITYGDLSTPTYVYRKEQALITNIKQQFSMSSVISYVISAQSSAILSTVGNFSFDAYANERPSNVIRDLLYKYNEKYGLLQLFPGMRNRTKVENAGLLPTDDLPISIEAKVNTSVFDYLAYLVSLMRTSRDVKDTLIKSSLFTFIVVDDLSGDFDGVYFKIVSMNKDLSYSPKINTYTVDIGYPSANVVTSFSVDSNEVYSMLYKYNEDISTSSYTERIDDNGKLVQVYSPTIGTSKEKFVTTESQKTWWTKVTEFPITATLTLKGLLRPAILMSYVRLNVLFYGRKHISSGLYIITKQYDTIDTGGYRTTLSLTRIGEDDEFI